MTLSKKKLGMAGKYAVASEICRRDFHAEISSERLGHQYVLVRGMMTNMELHIEVKTKQGYEWPGVKGVGGELNLLVLVDFENKKEKERPDFYVLSADDWKTFFDNYVRPRAPAKIDENYCPTWKDGYVGTHVRPTQVGPFKEKWDKIEQKLKSYNSSESFDKVVK